MNNIAVIANFPTKPTRGSRVELELPGSKIPVRITVGCETASAVSAEITGYSVSWPSIGAVSPEIAEDFANAILAGVKEARALTEKFHGKNIE